MPKFLALAVVALFAAGCGTGRIDLPGTASIDPSFTASQTEIILDAFDRWKTATHGVASIDVTTGSGGALHVYPTTLGPTVCGRTTIDGEATGTIKLDLDAVHNGSDIWGVSEGDALLDTVMHELGHAFGLHHVPGGLMRAEGYGGIEVDPYTVLQFCGNYDCP